eukprot:TRINITY_DN9431_c0_g1_i1.p1 TRINITY_DN9431_c0_g1~~TRINITY_DN9431_c0_g1_i1.p1  ORF type:complete len:476 (+),score=122.20 TRINITY_DN9431_c0_g1_i1:54-1481(+)
MRGWVAYAALAVAAAVDPAPRQRVVDFEAAGAVAGNASTATAWANGALLNKTFAEAKGDAQAGTVLLVAAGKEFFLMGGILADGVVNFTLDVQGKLTFSNDLKAWPRDSSGRVCEALHFTNAHGLTVTGGFRETEERIQTPRFLDVNALPSPYNWTGQVGVIDGNGAAWWGIPLVGYLVRQENRPRLLKIESSQDVLVERVYLRNSAYWTFLGTHCRNMEVRYALITAMRDDAKEWMRPHSDIAMTAFNTDGFDFSATDGIYVHDSEVWNQDDTVCMKDDTHNAVVERVAASGVGLTIGSVGNSRVTNITFRDSVMRYPVKAVYMKFRSGGGNAFVQDVTYENIQVKGATGWAIWMGPAQQSDSVELCAAHPCSLCWPELPFTKCSNTYSGAYERITLRNITVLDQPKGKSPGVIIGDAAKQIRDLTWADVQVHVDTSSKAPLLKLGWWKRQEFFCTGVSNASLEGTNVPTLSCK